MHHDFLQHMGCGTSAPISIQGDCRYLPTPITPIYTDLHPPHPYPTLTPCHITILSHPPASTTTPTPPNHPVPNFQLTPLLDLLGTAWKRLLVYSDWVHQDPGNSHTGGIAEDPIWQSHLWWLVALPTYYYYLSNGTVSMHFLCILAT